MGEQLRAQHLIDGVSYQITKIKAGSGHVATAALARARTDIVTPFVPARENDSPQGIALANDPVAQVRYIDAASVTYDIKEFGAFAGTQMTHYICDDGGATLYPKTPTLTLDVGLYIAVASGDQAAFTFGDEIKAPLATNLVPGLTRLATGTEVGNAIDGTDPTGAAENKVPTLQAIFDNRAKFGTPHVAQTAAPTSTQITNAEAGTVWLVYAA